MIFEGREIEVPIFDTQIIPGKVVEENILQNLAEEEKIEEKIHCAIKKLEILKKKYKNHLQKNLLYFYEAGKVLRFVEDNAIFKKQKGRIWQRMSRDIAPNLFLYSGGNKISESKRYPEFMYLLAKIPQKFIKRASWDQWYEILKFKEIYKKQKFLTELFKEKMLEGSGPSLREKIKNLIKRSKK